MIKPELNQYIYAHRGASGYAPENTLPAFKLAAELGAHGVELDVQMSRDGELVIAHDEKIDRVSDGCGWIRDMTLAELKKFDFSAGCSNFTGTEIPTLKEVFKLLLPTNVHINIELKNSIVDYPDLERKCIELAEKEFSLNRIIFSSFNHYSMRRVKDMYPNLYCGLLYEATFIDPWKYAIHLGMDALHPHYSEVLIPGDECKTAHKHGIQINTWTVNEEEDIRAVLDAGADILITNYPDRALKILKEKNNAEL